MHSTLVNSPSPDSTAAESEMLDPSDYLVAGSPLAKLPKDLYIPPEALHVFLDTFQGPLDLLLYLIKKQNIEILDIPIAEITRQYMHYIELMKAMQMDLAAEYLLMAAMLAEIKSRMLLPRPESYDAEDDLDHDPRAELIRRLQEYERFKNAAQAVSQLPQYDRDTLPALADMPQVAHAADVHPDVSMPEIMQALAEVLKRVRLNQKHTVKFEALSIRERMSSILDLISPYKFTPFNELFIAEEGKVGVVVTLLAILELLRQSALELVQAQPFADIYIKMKGTGDQDE